VELQHEQRAQHENQRPRSAPLSAHQAHALQERSRAALERRAAATHALAVKAQQRAALQKRLLAKVHVSAPRDPSRLLRPTTASARRAEAERADAHEPRMSGYIRNVPHKAAPVWTQQ